MSKQHSSLTPIVSTPGFNTQFKAEFTFHKPTNPRVRHIQDVSFAFIVGGLIPLNACHLFQR